MVNLLTTEPPEYYVDQYNVWNLIHYLIRQLVCIRFLQNFAVALIKGGGWGGYGLCKGR